MRRFIVVLWLAIGGCSGKQEPSKDASTGEATKTRTDSNDTSSRDETISVSRWTADYDKIPGEPLLLSVTELLDEFEANQLRAEKKFWKAKTTAVGLVKELGRDGKLQYADIWDENYRRRDATKLRCYFADESALESVSRNQIVKVSGLVGKMDGYKLIFVGKTIEPTR